MNPRSIGIRVAVTLGWTVWLTSSIGAQHGRPIDVPTRARGADRIVVATVAEVHPALIRNQFGDQLIVSRATLQVVEVLKGPRDAPLIVGVEGGTLNGVTLRASDLPAIQVGDRAVFFLRPGAPGEYVPHLRGFGLLKLDSNDVVTNESGLTLSDVRAQVRGAVK